MSLRLFVMNGLLFLGAIANAQQATTATEREQDAVAVIQVDGATSPEMIPNFLKVLHFVGLFESGYRPKLSDFDTEVLRQFVEREKSLRKSDEEMYVADFVANCNDLKTRSAVELATSMDEIAARSQERQVKRLEEALSLISAEERGEIWKFIDEKITPGIKYVSQDNVLAATRAPASFQRSIAGACAFYVSGARGNFAPPQPLATEARGSESADTPNADRN